MSSNPQPFLHFFWNSPFIVWMPYSLAVPTRIALMNQTVHLNTVNRIIHAWTITSLKSCYLPNFLKPPYSKKIIKDNVVQSMFSFHKIFINLEKIMQSELYCPLNNSLSISIKSLCFISVSFEKHESGTIQVDHTVLLETYVILKTHMVCCCILIHTVLSRILYIVFSRM